MVFEFLSALGYGFLQVWLNPVLYFAFFLALIVAFFRVKKERLHFYIRIYDVVSDLYHTFIPGLLAGLLLSGIFIGVGFVLSKGIVILLAAVTVLLSCLFQPRVLSSAYVIFVTAVGIVFLPDWLNSFTWLSELAADLQVKWLPNLLLIGVVLLFMEALLIMFQAKRQVSPRRVSGKRGKPVGGFEVNRIWLVPAFIAIPGTVIERVHWWPLFGDGSLFTFLLFPFLIGFRQFQTYDLPEKALKRDGLRVAVLAALFLPLAILTYVYKWPAAAFVFTALMFIFRLSLYKFEQKQSTLKQEYFTLKNKGLQILAIVPKTPAAEMNLKVGETIQRVNGIDVNNATQFYEALQTNPTFFKLEVIDENGEVRFEQRALYDQDHHSLGLLFVDEPRIQYKQNQA